MKICIIVLLLASCVASALDPASSSSSSSFLRSSTNVSSSKYDDGGQLGLPTTKEQTALVLQEAKEMAQDNIIIFEEALQKLSSMDLAEAPSELRDLVETAERAAQQVQAKIQMIMNIYDENLDALTFPLAGVNETKAEEVEIDVKGPRTLKSNRRKFSPPPPLKLKHRTPHHKKFQDIQDALTGGDHNRIYRMLQDFHGHHTVRHSNQGSQHRRRAEVQSLWKRASFGERVLDADAANARKQKFDRCRQLASCVQDMSLYDAIYFFHSDDINKETGDLDERVKFNNELNRIPAILRKAKEYADPIADFEVSWDQLEPTCDPLLQLFHRTVEGSAPLWEGGTVTEVCFAQGTTQYINLADIVEKVSVGIVDFIFNDVLICARELWDAHETTGQRLPFFEVGSLDSGFYIGGYPTGLDENALDEFGQLKSNQGIIYSYVQRGCDNGPEEDDECKFPLSRYSIRTPSSWSCQDACTNLSEDNCGGHFTGSSDRDHIKLETACEVCIAYFDESNSQQKLKPGITPLVVSQWVFDREIYAEQTRRRQRGLDLVFGSNASPGFVCGVKEAVLKHGKSMPGWCCLDAPYQGPDITWGSPFDCSLGKQACQRHGTFFGGFGEEACKVQGGTFCPNPSDCKVLKYCVEEMLAEATEESRMAYKRYLESSPFIDDPNDPYECGKAREYFGFQPTYIFDFDICENIEQLKFTQDFSVIDIMLTDAPDGGDGPGGMQPTDPPTQPPIPAFDVLKDPEEHPEKSEAAPVKNGLEWRSVNFAALQTATTLEEIVDTIAAVECLSFGFDPSNTGENVCKILKNTAVQTMSALYVAAHLIFSISKFTYEQVAEIDNQGPIQVWEYTKVIYQNTLAFGDYMRDRFVDLREATNQLILVSASTNDMTKQILARHNDKCDHGPSVQFIDGLAWKLPCKVERARCIEKYFPNEQEAQRFLVSASAATDECAHASELAVQVVAAGGFCDKSVFELTPTNNVGDPLGAATERIIVGVDDTAPAVTCGFDTTATSWDESFFVDGNFLLIPEQDSSLVLIPFYHDVDDNCAGVVEVNVAISGNTLTEAVSIFIAREMAETREGTDAAAVAIAPKTCASIGGFCVQSGATRYYKIKVTATDQAGNIGEAECFVGIDAGHSDSGSGMDLLKDAVSAREESMYWLGGLPLTAPVDGWAPTSSPSESPSEPPSFRPSDVPSDIPSGTPSAPPSDAPSEFPSTLVPSEGPSLVPSEGPSLVPSSSPTANIHPNVGDIVYIQYNVSGLYLQAHDDRSLSASLLDSTDIDYFKWLVEPAYDGAGATSRRRYKNVASGLRWHGACITSHLGQQQRPLYSASFSWEVEEDSSGFYLRNAVSRGCCLVDLTTNVVLGSCQDPGALLEFRVTTL